MLTKKESQIIKEVMLFADSNDINKSKIARELGTSRTTVTNIINKFKGCEKNVRK